MRFQLALNVTDLDEAVDFYSKMFDMAPTKVRPGYANFAVTNPPLKLALFETESGSDFQHINHLGVEAETADEVVAAEARISAAGIETTGVEEAVCCYAEKTEAWMLSPDEAKWEWYVKGADTEQMERTVTGARPCCG